MSRQHGSNFLKKKKKVTEESDEMYGVAAQAYNSADDFINSSCLSIWLVILKAREPETQKITF